MRVDIVGQERQHCVDQDKYDMRGSEKGVYLSLPLNFFLFMSPKAVTAVLVSFWAKRTISAIVKQARQFVRVVK